MIAIDFSKQQAHGTGSKAMQQINFTENLAWEGNANAAMVSWLKKWKKRF